jgi:hypothetical protein
MTDDDAPKDPHAASRHLTGSDWKCSECGAKNVSFATVCTGCGGLASKVKLEPTLTDEMGQSIKKGQGSAIQPQGGGSGKFVVLLVLLVLLGGAGFAWYSGKLDAYLPEQARSSTVLKK